MILHSDKLKELRIAVIRCVLLIQKVKNALIGRSIVDIW